MGNSCLLREEVQENQPGSKLSRVTSDREVQVGRPRKMRSRGMIIWEMEKGKMTIYLDQN